MGRGRPIEYLTPSQAVDHAATLKIFISIPTVIKWTEEWKLGHQLGGKGGKWCINKTKFQNYLNGKTDD